MAKIIPIISIPPGFTVKALQFQQQPGGRYSMGKHPNNLKSTSPSYITMNQTVVTLDALFKQLSTPDKAAWNAAAAGLAGITVCGCNAITIDGQKFFRLVNFLQVMGGSPLINTPPPTPPLTTTPLITVIRHEFGGPPPWVYEFIRGTVGQGEFFVINIGLGLSNPTVPFGAGNNSYSTTFVPPISDVLDKLGTEASISWCAWDFNTCPCATGTCPFLIDP